MEWMPRDSRARGQNGAAEEEQDPELAPEMGYIAGTTTILITAKPDKATPKLDPLQRDPVHMITGIQELPNV